MDSIIKLEITINLFNFIDIIKDFSCNFSLIIVAQIKIN